jgi:hypothetical protein
MRLRAFPDAARGKLLEHKLFRWPLTRTLHAVRERRAVIGRDGGALDWQHRAPATVWPRRRSGTPNRNLTHGGVRGQPIAGDVARRLATLGLARISAALFVVAVSDRASHPFWCIRAQRKPNQIIDPSPDFDDDGSPAR